jgi:hypothetical protein
MNGQEGKYLLAGSRQEGLPVKRRRRMTRGQGRVVLNKDDFYEGEEVDE